MTQEEIQKVKDAYIKAIDEKLIDVGYEYDFMTDRAFGIREGLERAKRAIQETVIDETRVE